MNKSGSRVPKTELVEFSWGRCAVDSSGSGPAVLLVHGFPMDRSMWRAQVGHIHDQYLIAPDLRGLGQSVTSHAATSLADYADDLAELLDHMDIERAVVCGLSMGGYISFEMWRRHSHRIQGLVLVATRSSADSETAARGRLEAKRRVREVGMSAMASQMPERLVGNAPTSAVLDRLRSMIAEAPPDGVVAALDAMRERGDSTRMLGSISVPTLVVAGTGDKIVPLDEMRAMSEAIPGSRLVEIKNAGHVPPVERPGEFNRALEDFLREVR